MTSSGSKTNSREQILARIIDWSGQLDLSGKIVSDPTTDFRLLLSEPNMEIQVAIQVIHPNIQSKYVLVEASVSFNEEDQKKLENVKDEKLDTLFWETRHQLLSLALEFIVIKPERIPISWSIFAKLFVEEAKAQDFYNTYIQIKDAALSIIWSYSQLFLSGQS